MATLGTFTAGQVLTAAELNALNNVCALRRTTSLAVTNGTEAAVTFGAGTEIYDPSGWHSTSTNTDRITPNVAGIYWVSVTTYLGTSANGDYYTILRKNGNQYDIFVLSDQDWIPSMTISTVVSMNGTTDYLSTGVWQLSGTTQNWSAMNFSVMLLAKS